MKFVEEMHIRGKIVKGSILNNRFYLNDFMLENHSISSNFRSFNKESLSLLIDELMLVKSQLEEIETCNQDNVIDFYTNKLRVTERDILKRNNKYVLSAIQKYKV